MEFVWGLYGQCVMRVCTIIGRISNVKYETKERDSMNRKKERRTLS